MDASVTSTFHAPDIECDRCADTVRAVVASVDGVVGVDVDLVTGTVQVEHDPARSPEAVIRAALEEAGYPTTP